MRLDAGARHSRPRLWRAQQRASAARLKPVANSAEPWKGCRPNVARGAPDDAQGAFAAESKPLHHRDGGIVLAAGGIDASFIAGHAVDAYRLGHRDPRVADAGNRGCDLLGESASIVGLRRRGSDDTNYHKGCRLKSRRFIAVGENDGAASRQGANVFEIAKVADFERH